MKLIEKIGLIFIILFLSALSFSTIYGLSKEFELGSIQSNLYLIFAMFLFGFVVITIVSIIKD